MKTPSAYISKTASLLIIILSSIVLAGWFLHIPYLTTVFFYGFSMRFNAAFCLLLSGIVVYLMDETQISRVRKIIIIVLSSIILLTGIITYSQFAFGWNAGIDELLYKDWLTSFHGRMGFLISCNFILTGIIFFSLLGKRKPYLIVQVFLLIIFLNLLFIILNNFVGYSFFYNISLLNHTAYIASILFMVLVFSIINNKQCDGMIFSYSLKLFGYLITFGVFLFIAIFASFINSEKRIESTKLVEHTHEVILTAHQLRMNIYNVQNKTAEYLISDGNNYMSDFDLSKKSINSDLNHLLLLTADNVHQKSRLDSINSLAERYMASRIKIINKRRQNGFAEAQKLFSEDQGKLLMDKINSIFMNFAQEENQLLAQRKTDNDEFVSNNSKIIFLFLLVIFLLVIIVGIVIYNNQKNRNKTEKKLNQNLSLTNAVFESIHNGILVVNHKGSVIKYNDIFTEMWRIPEEIIKSNDDKILVDFILNQLSNPKEFITKINKLYDEPETESLDDIYFKDGRIFERISKPILVGSETSGRVWSFLDITERKKTEAEKIYQLQRYKVLMHTSKDAIHILDENGKLLEWNEAFLKHLGYSEEEASALNIWDWDTQWNKEALLKILSETKGNRGSIETLHKLKDGSLRNVEISLHQFSEKNKNFYYASARDITERKKADEKYRSILNTTIDGFYLVDWEGKIIDTNNSYCSMIGYSRDELLKMSIKDIDVTDTEEIIKNRLQQIFKTGYAFFETKHKCKDGRIIDIEASCGFSNTDKKEIFVFMRDITERKLAEEEIKKSIRINEFIGKTNELILLTKNENDIYNEISKIAVETGNFVFAWIGIPDTKTKTIIPFVRAGREDDYLKNKTVSTEDIPDGRGPTGIAYRTAKYYYCNDIANDPVMEHWRDDAIKYGYFSSVAFPLKSDDKVVSVITMYAAKANFFTDEELQLLVKVTNNISYALNAISNRKKRTETEIQLKKITQAVEQSSASIIITNLKPEIEYVNPAFTALTGYSFEEAIGKNPRILKSDLTPESTYPELWRDLINNTAWHGELCNRKKNGEIYWEQAVISPIANEQGEITNYVAVKENITERKNIEGELQKTNTELRTLSNHLQTIREEERSDIAKEIHDELSQNLVAISMNASLLKSKINDPAVKAIIDEQIEITNSVVKTSKTLFNSLHPSMLDELGLEAAIKWYAKTKLKLAEIQVEFRTNVNIGNDNISKEINLGFFRIYQETLSNILRHAKATTISTELLKTKEDLLMRIKDNGLGFDVDKIDTLHHHGILGIRERALAMGGEFTINSVVGKGTTVQVKVKL